MVLGNRAAKVGELIFEKDGERQFSMFRYAPMWLERKDAFAIAPAMPLVESPFVSEMPLTIQRCKEPDRSPKPRRARPHDGMGLLTPMEHYQQLTQHTPESHMY